MNITQTPAIKFTIVCFFVLAIVTLILTGKGLWAYGAIAFMFASLALFTGAMLYENELFKTFTKGGKNKPILNATKSKHLKLF